MSNNYDISIVTPFHNVDMEVFKAGIESMKMQTYGFDNIQWIVVVHNSESEYKKAVHEMLDSYENVIVKELDNDRRTPSSPRNYGISLATGNYIGFLDGDDSFTYDCIETVLEVIQRNKAQVVSFRREFELENDNDAPVTEIVLWDQIEKEIVIDKNNWDDVKMFSGVCGMVTSRVYDRKFLEENKLKFDESVLFGEDFLFNMEVYGRLERVVYLPQFIGYHYYINRGSLVQSGEKSPETLIAYAKGYTKIFDAGLKYGFYMNAIISRLCVVLSRFLVQSKSITIEQRKEIRDILEPYISKTTEITPSKVYPVKVVKEMYEIPRKVILNPEEWVKSNEGGLLVSNQEDIDAFNDKMTQTLSHILEKNQNTDMGKHYKFWDIMTVNDYRNHVPLSDYSDLEPLIKLTTRIGESDIFTAEEIDSYVTKENEAGKIDGKMRVFPITRRMVRGNARSFSRLIENRRCVILPDKPKGGIVRYNDAVYANTLERAILQELYSNRPGIVRPDVTSPQDLFFNDVNYDTRYLHLLFALRDADVEIILQPKVRWTHRVFEYIEENWNVLCDDIKNGTVSMGDTLPKELQDVIDRFLLPDKQRADELCKIFSEGFDSKVAKKIWPKLTAIYTNRSGDNEVYQDLKKRYIGEVDCIDLYYDTCGTIVGVGDTDGEAGLKMIERAAFYEFIPLEDMGKDIEKIHTLLPEEVVSGKKYELVITTSAGLYRYRTGDVIIVNRSDNNILRYTYDV